MKKKNEMLAVFYWMNYFSENYWDYFAKYNPYASLR